MSPESSKMPFEFLNGGKPVCPVCHGDMARIARRWVDRLWSLFVPVHRYRCRRYSCHWVGNVRALGSAPPAITMPEN